jgi:DNA (cytosine-5)-methyltransferase 1
MKKFRTRRASKQLSAVDLFCGVGGKTHGFLRAGIDVVAGIDVDPTCRFAYEHNNPPARFVETDVARLPATYVADLFPKGTARILIGCAPCQPFSTYSYRYRIGKRCSDHQWELLRAFRDIIGRVQPEIVSAENVPELATTNHPAYESFIERLESLGYHVSAKVVRCADYGVPQTRERLVVLASRLGPIELLPPTHPPSKHVTVRRAIGRLAPIEAGGPAPKYDDLHRACSLSPANLRRVRATPEGGSWLDWPARLRLACHRRNSGKTFPSVYGRMSWEALAPTLTTQCYGLGNGRFGHPDQDRAISLREAAILQTFPRDYRFVAPDERLTFKHVGRHIGNAVPVRLAEVIAESIHAHCR